MNSSDIRWFALARARNQRTQLELARQNPYPPHIESLIRAEIAKNEAIAELHNGNMVSK
jgi:hypothetical protein